MKDSNVGEDGNDEASSSARPPATGAGVPVGRLTDLDVLRGVAIIAVVGIHALGYAGEPGERWQRPSELIGLLGFGFAVPAFFFCDGYLLASSAGHAAAASRYGTQLARSARRLLWPWLAFSIIYTIARACGEAVHLFQDRLVLGQGLADVARNLWQSKIAMQLYFLPALFLIRCLRPILLPLTRAPRLLLPLVALASFFGYKYSGIVLGGDPITQALSGLRFVLVGIAACRFRREISSRSVLVIGVAGSLMLLVVLVPGFKNNLVYHVSSLIAVHAASIRFMNRAEILAAVGRQTMGIYLLHAPAVIKVVQVAVSPLRLPWPGRFGAIWALSFLIALALTRLISRHSAGRMLLGER